jgi:hypothetical protein
MILQYFLIILAISFILFFIGLFGKIALHNSDSRSYSVFVLISGVCFLILSVGLLLTGIDVSKGYIEASNYTYGCNLNCCDFLTLGACIGEGLDCDTYTTESDCIDRAQGCEWITNITCISNNYNLTNTTYLKSTITNKSINYEKTEGIYTSIIGLIFLLISLFLIYTSIYDLAIKKDNE